jgi:hypothetical protein
LPIRELRSQNAELNEPVTGNISAEHVAEEVSHYAESILETIREYLLVMNVDLKIISDFILGKWKRLEQATIKTEKGIVCLTTIPKRAKT